MARLVNAVLMCFHLITLGIGVAILVIRPFGTCYSLLYMPLVALGALIVVLSLLALLGLCFRSAFLMWLHLGFYIVLILVLTFIMFLEIIILTKDVARLEFRKTGVDYHNLDDFSLTFQNKFVGATTWPRIRQCLIHHDFCYARHGHPTYTRLQTGCCIAPLSCEQANNSSNPDCKLWKNEGKTMCYDCGTCKAGFLSEFIALWIKVFPGVIALLIVLIFIFTLGCHSLNDLKAKYKEKQSNHTVKP